MELSIDYIEQHASSMEDCSKVLGALLYLPPNSDQVQHCIQYLIPVLPQEWPFGDKLTLAVIQQQMQHCVQLKAAWQTLFVGPHHLAAPPWGSVYLDKESVIFGDFTLQWRAFLHTHHIVLETGNRDPEDHIGLLFWALTALLDQNNYIAVAELLEDFLLPWSECYLTLLSSQNNAFYTGVAQLTLLTQNAWRTGASLHPVEKQLYF